MLLPLLALVLAQDVPTPAEHLGRPLAADFELVDWAETASYYRRLAASPRVRLETVGETTEGREFLLATISSEANLASLDVLREHARRIADPRGLTDAAREAALAEGKVFLFVSIAMHATETAATQFAMAFAHALATEEGEPWASAREELVVLLTPCLNPDGLDHVTEWYRRTVGTPYEASELLKLYQLYSGHDNNRDWFMLTQDETRIVTELLYDTWHPQVYWDVHQQGSTRERLFVPPYRDPLNPNLDPAIVASIGALGARALRDLTAEGYTGVSTGVSYDMWWNGGNRNVPVRHNVIGLLTEAASVRLATPVFLPRDELSPPRGLPEYGPSNRFPAPWPGGWWRLADIVDYEMAFGRSLLASLARERRTWLENALAAAERVLERGRAEAPRAWLLPSTNRDVTAVARLVDVLRRGGVEVHRAPAELAADGRTWPAGTLVIRADQPYGAHVKDLFEVQRYPDGEPPYDVAGWTLPLLLGVHRVAVVEPLGSDALAALEPVTDDAWRASFAPPGPDMPLADSGSWTRVFRQLAGGGAAYLDTGEAERRPHPGGAPGAEERAGSGTGAAAGEHAREVGETGPRFTLEERAGAYDLALPRVGLYAPWSGVINEGWLRWVLDTFDLPYVRVRNEMLRAGELHRFLDVLILPDVSARRLDAGRPEGSVFSDYSGGLAPEGAVAIEEFVRRGGRLVAMEDSAAWAIELLRLPLVDVTRGDEAGEFSCPGSVLRAVPAPSDELDGSLDLLTLGLPDSLALFFSRARAWRPMTKDEREAAGLAPAAELPDPTVLLRYAPTRTLLSGWIREPETIASRAAWVRAEHGAGAVHLFAFRPQYRAWSQATFPLVFRAVLFDRVE